MSQVLRERETAKGEKMRELEIGTKKHTKVMVIDEPGEGGACHEYRIYTIPSIANSEGLACGSINFQKGPIKEKGVNGCHQEDLIAICVDRLQHFQAGQFKCRENAIALTHLEDALHWLRHRTNDREKRGVEGTNTL